MHRSCLILLACSVPLAAAGSDIEWRDLSFEVKGKKVLDGVHGRARAGRILAIMGPSGSGKTSILNALAGQTRATKGATLGGILSIDGQPVTSVTEEAAGIRSAYVKQQDAFYSQMTVRETLMFAARLRLPKSVPVSEREEMVENLLRKLSLVKAADTIIGAASSHTLCLVCQFLMHSHLHKLSTVQNARAKSWSNLHSQHSLHSKVPCSY